MISPQYKQEIHRMFVKETTTDDVIKAMYKAHEAQMRRNKYKQLKEAKICEGQISYS